MPYSLTRTASIPRLKWQICLLITIILLVKSSLAQVSGREISVQAGVFTVIASVLCSIFWCCFICMCFSRQQCTTNSGGPLSPAHNTYNESNTHQNHAIDNEVSYSEFSRSISLYPAQRTRVAFSTSTPETVAFPQATVILYQDDAPPSYEEAVRM